MNEIIIQYADLFYGNRVLALTGCHMTPRAGPSCEINVLVYPATGERKVVRSGKSLVEFIPTSIPLSLPASHSVPIRDFDFKYNELVDRDEGRFYGKALRASLESAIKALVLGRQLDIEKRRPFVIMAATYLADGYLLSKMEMPSPSHIYRQLNETAPDKVLIISKVFEEDVAFGSLLWGRATAIRRMLNRTDGELFIGKFQDHFKSGRNPEANFYLMHSLQLLNPEQIPRLGRTWLSGEDILKEEDSLLKEIKVLSQKAL